MNRQFLSLLQFGPGWPRRIFSTSGLLALGLALGLALSVFANPAEAAIVLRAASSAGVSSGSLTLSKPAGTAVNDVMVATVAVRPRTTSISTPSGWTVLRDTLSTNSDAASTHMVTFWRRADGSEGGSFTFTLGSGHTGAAGGIVAFSGVDTGTAINVSGETQTASGFSHAASSISTTVASTMLVSSHAFASTTSDWTPPSGMTEAVDAASVTRPDVAGMSIEMNYATQSAVGATGTKTATAASAGTDAGNGVVHLLALRPAAEVLNCFTDDFNRASPGSDWSLTNSGGSFGNAQIVANRLRMTDASGNVATAAHLQRLFPGAGNKIVVEFDHLAYGGSGADGVSVVLSDASVTPTAGAYGGSLGYAQRDTPTNGFAGGWLGVGLDEYGNFANATEGRSGGTGFTVDSVTVRGSGSGTTGYNFHATSGTLSPGVDQALPSGISHVGAGSMADASSGNVTPSLPTHQADDILLCAVTSNDNIAHGVSTSGWAEVYQLTRTGSLPRASLWWKRASSSSETNPTVTHTGSGGIVANCSAFRGVDTSVAFDVAYASGAKNDTSNDNDIISGGLTTVTNGAVVLFVGHVDNNRCPVSEQDGDGLTWNQSFCAESSEGSDETATIQYAAKAVAGAVNPITFRHDNNDENRGILVALRPAPVTPSAHRYRIIIDHADGTHAWVSVERDTTGTGSSYSTIVTQYDAKAQAGQAAVPTHWMMSYTGSTGSATNIHEIDNLSVCTLLPIGTIGLHHVRLDHDGAGVTCTGSTVTVRACDGADSSGTCTANTAGVSGNVVAKSGGGTVLATVPFSIPNGSSSVSVSVPVTTAQTATFEVSGLSAATSASPAWTCWNGSAASCSHAYGDAGFIVASAVNGAEATIATQTAGVVSSTHYLRAVKTSSTTGACEGALAGAGTVDIAYECTNPATCSGSNLMSVNGGTATTVTRNNSGGVSSYASVGMTFDGNGNAPFTLTFSDAGMTRLHFRKTVGGVTLAGTSSAFVTKPFGFALTNTNCADAIANSASQTSPGTGDPKFCRAGQTFQSSMQAIAQGGGATPNYGKEATAETLKVVWSRHLPAPGSDGTLPSGNPSFSGANGLFGPGTYTNGWSEVGILKAVMSVGDGNYLGAGDVSSTGYAGRFYPHHFDTVVTPQCGGFVYSGRPGSPTTTPGQPFSVDATAKNAGGVTTANYAGNFAKSTNLSASTGKVYVDAGQGGSGAIPATAYVAGVGTVLHSVPSGKISFAFDAYPTADTAITVHADDADSATSTGSDGSVSARSGRLRLLNAYGSELLKLRVPVRAEYYSSTGWRLNTADTCTGTSISSGMVGLRSAGPTVTVDGIVAGIGGNGTWDIRLNPPSGPGMVDLALNLGTSTTLGAADACLGGTNITTGAFGLGYLASNWCGSGFDKFPAARLRLGSPKAPYIYLRERF